MFLGKSESFYIVIVSIFTYFLGIAIQSFGINRRIYNHVPGECSSIGQFSNGISGFDTSFEGTVFLSANRCYDNCSTTLPSNIFIFQSDNKTVWELIIDSKKKLNAGSLSLTPSRNKIHVFVVNHGRKDSVEVYNFNEKRKSLKHLRTVKSKIFLNLQDVAAVDREKFFVTSHSHYESTSIQNIEKVLNLKSGAVLFFDGKRVQKLVDVASPVGVIYDRFRSLLFVASFSQEAIHVYRVGKDYSLHFVNDIKLFCSPYSIWRDIDNSMIITCHPVLLRFFSYNYNQTSYYSPSQVLRIYYRPSAEPVIQQLYANDGATVSAAISSIRTGNSLLIGSRSDLLECDLPSA
ncbi:unnamed protein product [Auanema sp. JU1783]|nr:unnamed protein product [Auanema sp. JU1783]